MNPLRNQYTARAVAADAGEVARGQPMATVSCGDTAADAFWLLCQAASHRIALPMRDVVEIMRMLPIRPLAGTLPMVKGLCVIRGVPTPVIDAASLLDDTACRCERLVTVRTGRRMVALATDAVLGVQAIDAHDLEQMPPILSDIKTIAAVKTLDDELVLFLNAARVIPEDVLERCMTEGASA